MAKYAIKNKPTGKYLCIRESGRMYFSHTHPVKTFPDRETAESFRKEYLFRPDKNEVVEIG